MKYHVSFDLELKKNPYKGVYIAIEGIDGCGKTTQAEELAKYFKEQGRDVLVTFEPQRSGVIGDLIHKVLQHEVKIPKEATQYLFASDRAIHQKNKIIPALEAGKVVISDRNFWSSIAYGILDKEGSDLKKHSADYLLTGLSILSMYHQFIAPDFTFYLDIDVKMAITRIKGLNRKAEIYEKEELLLKVQEIYSWMTKEFEDSFITIRGDKKIDQVTSEMVSVITSLQQQPANHSQEAQIDA